MVPWLSFWIHRQEIKQNYDVIPDCIECSKHIEKATMYLPWKYNPSLILYLGLDSW
jgi:hypothetical protein